MTNETPTNQITPAPTPSPGAIVQMLDRLAEITDAITAENTARQRVNPIRKAINTITQPTTS